MKTKIKNFTVVIFLFMTIANNIFCQDWELDGNVTIDPTTDMLGTTDNSHLPFRTSNTEWMRLTHTQGWLGLHTTTPLGTFHQHNY